MKNKKIIIIIVVIILILGMIFAYWLYQNSEKNMDYKFENDKLIQDDAEKELTDVKSHYKGNLDNIPKKITPTEAAERGYFVYDFVGGKVYNEDILRRFVKNTEMNAENRIADEIIIVIYNINGDPFIYNLGYKYRENLGYVLAKDCTRVDISQTEMADENGYVNAPDEFYEVVVNTDIPEEHYGITIKDSGFSSQIISLTSYSEDYKNIEIARYMNNSSN